MRKPRSIQALARRQFGSIGDLGCGGIDVDTWRRANRATVYPGKWNRWIIVGSVPKGLADQAIVDLAVEFFWESFGEPWHIFTPVWTQGATEIGPSIDLWSVKRIATSGLGFGSADKVQDFTHLPTGPAPMLQDGEIRWLEVAFVWRSHDTEVAWPCWNGGQLFGQSITDSAKFCPVGASWMLDEIGKPLDDAPPPRSLLSKAVEEGADVTKDWMKVWKVPLLLGGIGLGLIILAKG